MSTRGTIGFRHNDKDYLTYNHCDSYPEGLGATALALTKKIATELGIDYVRNQLDNIKVITETTGEPTPEDITALTSYTDLSVAGKSTSDWYCLMRNLQGNLEEMLKAGYISVDNDFIYDSLFCEWAYIINLDTNTLEVYKGFIKDEQGEGRYQFDISKVPGHRRNSEETYFPCSLIKEFDFDSLPEEEDFVNTFNIMDEEEEFIDEAFDEYFETSYANIGLLREVDGKLDYLTHTSKILDAIFDAFKSGFNIGKKSKDSNSIEVSSVYLEKFKNNSGKKLISEISTILKPNVVDDILKEIENAYTDGLKTGRQ